MWGNGSSPKARVLAALKRLGIRDLKTLNDFSDHRELLEPSATHPHGVPFVLRSPINGETLCEVKTASTIGLHEIRWRSEAAFTTWRMTPAPVRGEFVRRLGLKLREFKNELAELIVWEVGKIPQEALGEVQEMIDICDFAVGLSRQLHGLTIASERPRHRLMEQWLPLGPVMVISAFNFPMAVWAWNAALAWVCGNPVVWKPSEKTSLCAIGVHAIVKELLTEMPEVPEGIASLVLCDREVAKPDNWLWIKLISATGSTRMGYEVAKAARLTRTLLELGGNNGMIVCPTADIELAVRAIVFGAVGTCGQRCTTLRRLFVHRSRYQEVRHRLLNAYRTLPIGDPATPGVLVGPLIDEAAFQSMQEALEAARSEGGTVHFGERITNGVPAGGYYVRPALVEMPVRVTKAEHVASQHAAPTSEDLIGADVMSDPGLSIMDHETFAPILYMMPYTDLDQAIALHNDVSQGLSSAILTNDLREAELFCSAAGSDCGLVNVNCGTSGAEIGGAFGGDKDTGGGRESGSDAWKNYMRRVTSTINWSGELPLAQGIQFDL
ncbi:Aldehyde dehydrogenase, thermostable [Caulifigura coniformis]|uniref:Aldehyde dehydrogenase, thermostable n=1 Tax=Caulifigura coniformis TaxID=2527983 RepID=A0A517SN02_9PLAN|nr:aldehyde dehydrogenase family protein [Caulifigura coniformis]QDT57501.1 Aldehyde dehydrogenase, thermostable [Caulifigura coniformis]